MDRFSNRLIDARRSRARSVADLGAPQLPQLTAPRLRRLVHHPWIRVRVLVTEVEVVNTSDGDHVDVAVRHLQTREHHPNPCRLEGRHLRLPDGLRSFEEVV